MNNFFSNDIIIEKIILACVVFGEIAKAKSLALAKSINV